MVCSFLRRLPWRATLSGAALLALAGLPARGQYAPAYPPPVYYAPLQPSGVMYPGQPSTCPAPMPPYGSMAPMPYQPFVFPPHPCLPGVVPPAPEKPREPSETRPPSETTRPPETSPSEQGREQTPTQTQDQSQNQNNELPNEQGSASGTGDVVMGSNIVGDLLGATNSVAFFYERSSGNVFLQGTGGTSFIIPKVAENNSPIPRDRVSFRYNYFSNSEFVTGDSGRTVYAPQLGVSQTNSAPRFQGITTTQPYNVNQFTFDFEKTFLNGWGSVEVRLPFSYTLGNNLGLSVANPVFGPDTHDASFTNSNGIGIVGTTPTPQDTFGQANTEIGNMTLIFKGLAYQSPRFYVSGGTAVGIPTARATNVRVTDYLGDFEDNDTQVQRVRDFVITNETWSLSPYLASLWFPTRRWFTQGFLQCDVPLNKSRIIYSELPQINNEPNELTTFQGINVEQRIREQTLMSLDVGTGYYLLLRGPQEKAWINAFAPSLELHYTRTLNGADIETLPLAPKGSDLVPVGLNGLPSREPGPQVGNLRNRLNILDLTVASTLVAFNRATIATGFAFPLTQGTNRTFDWEFQLQLNYYFGPGGFLYYRPRTAPNLL